MSIARNGTKSALEKKKMKFPRHKLVRDKIFISKEFWIDHPGGTEDE